jgi:hypothetical protein
MMAGANPWVGGTDLEDLIQRIKKLGALVGEKVDCDTFDNELMSIREMIRIFEPSGGYENAKLVITAVVSAPAPSKERGPQLSTKNLNKIKEINPINHRLDKLEQGHSALKRIGEDMKIYFGRQVDSLAAKITSAFRFGTPGTPSQHSPICGSEEILKLNGEIDKLKHLFDEMFNSLL